jgi:gliding motility-associated-like protein
MIFYSDISFFTNCLFKNKYLNKLVFFFLFLIPFEDSYAQINCPPNIDFEEGSFNLWNLGTGIVKGIEYTDPNGNTFNSIHGESASGLNEVEITNSIQIPNQHELIEYSQTNPEDYYGKFPINSPNGSSFVLKLGSDKNDPASTKPNAQAERATYVLNVPAGAKDYSITYQYAVVFEDPGHLQINQPRFSVKLSDAISGQLVSCGFVEYIADSTIPGFSRSIEDPDVWFKSWTPVFINLSKYSGRTLNLEFTTADCTHGGHWGYAYLDVDECKLSAVANNGCQQISVTELKGPPGFQSYKWWNHDFTQILATGQNASINPALSENDSVFLELLPFSGAGCRDTITVQIEKDSLVIGKASDKEICKGGNVTIGFLSALPNCNYSWTSDSLTNIPPNPSVQVQPENTSEFYLTVTNTLTGCKAYDTIRVVVNEGPFASIQPDTVFGCPGEIIQFSNLSDQGMAYQWNALNAITWADGQFTPIPTPPLNIQGNYYFQLQVTNPVNGCSSYDTAFVGIKPGPKAVWNVVPTEGCDSLRLTFEDLSQNGDSSRIWFSNNTFLNIPTNTTQISYKIFTPDTISAYLVSYGNCPPDTTGSVSLLVRKSPEAGFNASTTSVPVWPNDTIVICAGETVQFNNLHPGIAGIAHNWNFGDGPGGSSLESPQHSYFQTGLFQVTLRETFDSPPACQALARKFVLVKPQPLPSFTGPAVVCEDAAITFQNTSQHGSYFTWYLLQGSNVLDSAENNSAWTFPAPAAGNYTVRIRVRGTISSAACASLLEKPLSIQPGPVLAFSIQNPSICLNDSLRLNNLSGTGMNYAWFLGNSNTPFSTLFNPQPIMVSSSGQIPVRLKVTIPQTGCFRWDTAVLAVSNVRRTKARLEVNPPYQGCDTLRVLFKNQSIDASAAWMLLGYNDLQLPFSGTNPNVVFTYPDTGRFQTRLVAEGQCNRDTVNGPVIRVWPSPKTGFTASTLLQPNWTSDTVVICVNDTVRFLNSYPQQQGVKYRWRFSESGTVYDGIHPAGRTYLNPGLYTVRLQAVSDSGSCLSEKRKFVRVKPLPSINLNIVPSAVCAGSTVTLDASGTQNAIFYSWIYSEGGIETPIDTGASPIIQYLFQQASQSNISIRLIAYNSTSRNSCLSELNRNVVVRPKPVPVISMNDSAGCSPLTVSFSRNAEAFGGGETVSWSFGDGRTYGLPNFNLPPLTYTNTDSMELVRRVKLQVTYQGCTDSSVRYVRIYPVPIAGFTFPAGFNLTQLNPVLQLEENINPKFRGWIRHYDFGDGRDTSIYSGPNTNLFHRYDTTGIYTVMQKVIDLRYPAGCSDSLAFDIVRVSQSPPIAEFKVNGKDSCEVCENDTVTFSNQSRFVTQSSLWDFGNGRKLFLNGANRYQPQKITYPKAGTYQVSLTVKNEKGVDTVVKRASVVVHPKPVSSFRIEPNVFDYPIFKGSQPIQTINESTGATRFFWNFGENPQDTIESFNASYRYTIPGNYTISLQSISDMGCPDTFLLSPKIYAFLAGLWVPDAFSPNADGLNDDWQIFHKNVVSFELFVYNQWGEQLFYSTDPDKRWDGTFGGAYCPNAGYAYRIRYTLQGMKDQESEPITITGVVTLKR